ncbi:hypothetical protein J6590_056754 [Homalodisca vitripennis]|nr:hypothetical protein J6590_056754 [Homalodisca vitripennis]
MLQKHCPTIVDTRGLQEHCGREGLQNIVQLLLIHEASKNIVDVKGSSCAPPDMLTPNLIVCNVAETLNIVQLLLIHEASKNIVDVKGSSCAPPDMLTPNLIVCMLQKHCPTIVDTRGLQEHCGREGLQNIVQLLLIHEASKNIVDVKGSSCAPPDMNIVQLLLIHEASKNIVDVKGSSCAPPDMLTPNLIVCNVAETLNIVQLLLIHEASKNIMDVKGSSCAPPDMLTPNLIVCNVAETLNIVQLLLTHEASTNIVDVKGSSPLHLAAWTGSVDIVRLLLTHGPSVPNVNLTICWLAVSVYLVACGVFQSCCYNVDHIGLPKK